ncbi:malonic semialdehyde reductase [Auraticoccus sp. F435]|uniref:Malonic semialdehyde reductase n=1 Tax=Auraticoccus cholistanensis TaxID=2656650 RepID=A0A6A9V093_9ACTN|nr:malonic semialdehyde reductase [Auraticoccus cholistanensis]MVA75020.1 malonic semialdehyde reductase [Auraticoccus cholistanensis]
MSTMTSTALLALSEEAQDLLFREARTANAFTDEPVTPEQVEAVHDLVKWGPTAMNTQPLRVVQVRSRAAREDLVAAMAEGNRAKTLAAPLTLLMGADERYHEQMATQFPHFPRALEVLEPQLEQRRRTATLNAALQIGYWITGIRAAGLAAGPMTGFDAAQVEARFFPDGHTRALVVVNVGHPAADAFRPRGRRLEVKTALSTV